MARSAANTNLFLATVAFAIAFALWGLISGLAPIFKAEYRLTATQTSLMVAIPVLLGSLGRIPAGLLTDRYGGRRVFSVLLLLGAIPALALAADHRYESLLFWGFWIGLTGSSFAVGVGFVSPWFPAQRQGLALGVFGVGNAGQSVAVFAGPLLAATLGVAATFSLFGLASLAWGVVFAVWARDAAKATPPPTLAANLRVVREEPLAWLLSLFYFLTFGGFVALGVFLPTLLRDLFHLSPGDAGARTAGFVVLATLCRPLGGWLADRIGGQRVLRLVFPGLAALAWLLTSTSIYLFTLGALGCAALLGLGNGAVFKLVPKLFPKETGTVSGLVGAAGGLGGFFPPLLLGVFHDLSGSYAPGFVLLSAFALGCRLLLGRVRALAVPAPAASTVEETPPEARPDRWTGQATVRTLLDGEPRLTSARVASISLRALHLVASGLVLGGFAFGAGSEQLWPWLALSLVTGVGLIALEVQAVGRSWLLLGKGALVLVKMPLLALALLDEGARVPLLVVLVVAAAVSSHLPRRYRNYALGRLLTIGTGR